jgi:hypothetical protein
VDPLQTALAAHTPLEAFDDGDLDAAAMAPPADMSSAPLPEPRENGPSREEAEEAVDRQIFGALVTL